MKASKKRNKLTEKEELINNFKEDWYELFSISFLNEKGKKELKDLVLSEKYEKLSSRKIAAALHIGRGSIDAMRRKDFFGEVHEEEKKKKGRPRKQPPVIPTENMGPKVIMEEDLEREQELVLK